MIRKRYMVYILCLAMAGLMLLTGCGSGSETASSAAFTEEKLESLAGTTVEAEISYILESDTEFDIGYQITLDDGVYAYNEVFEIAEDDERSPSEFADECYGMTESSVADLQEGDTVTITFNEYSTICALTAE